MRECISAVMMVMMMMMMTMLTMMMMMMADDVTIACVQNNAIV